MQWVDVFPSVWSALRTADDIRFQIEPTRTQWVAERVSGWPGSDGSSNSPDTIWGLPVGETTGDFRPDLATWCHDEDYRTIRRLVACGIITPEEAEKLRRRADEALLLRLMRQIESASWILRPLRRRRALKYYEGVLLGGAGSIIPRADESYPRLKGS